MREKIYTHLKESEKFERPLDIQAALGIESTGMVCGYLSDLESEGRIEFPCGYRLETEIPPSLSVRAVTKERKRCPNR